MKKNLSRRNFLLQAGGATLVLPFLPSVLPKALGAGGRPPKRFIAVSHRYGHHVHHFFPSVGADIKINNDTYYKRLADIGGQISPIFDSKFDAYRTKMNIYQGMDSIGGGDHNQTVPLTGAGHTGEAGENSPPVFGKSIDVLMAKSPNVYDVMTRFDAIRIANANGEARGISWDRDSSGKSVQLSFMNDDKTVFNSVFDGFNPSPEAQAANQKHKLLVDRVFERYVALRNNPRMSQEDRLRFERHVASVTDMQKRLQIGAAGCSIPSLNAFVSGQMPQETLWRNQVDNLVAAMSCDLTRVGVLFVSDHQSGTSGQNYAVSHANSHDRDAGNAGGIAQALDYSRFKADQILYLLQKLSNTMESDGTTMLDNTVVLWTAELSSGNHHKAYSLPTATFGNCQGALKTGYLLDTRLRPIRYEANRGDFLVPFGQAYNRLLITIMRAMGMQPAEYMSAGDGGGFGQYNPRPTQYIGDEYQQYIGLRNDPLPIVFG